MPIMLVLNSKYISEQDRVDFLTNEMEKQFNVPLPLEKKKAHFGKAEPG